MQKLNKIGVLSVAKVNAVIGAILGLIWGIFAAITGTSFAVLGGLGFMAGLGLWSIIVFPIIYALIGFIGGVIGAFLYNLVAGWIGGIEIELK
ncbi:MAG: hypothetical protein PWQ87_369 [Candidatus Woesearchaeota archaeon]|nr:hypothetical protein [Candidatus Woesearchaeota archaeon]